MLHCTHLWPEPFGIIIESRAFRLKTLFGASHTGSLGSEWPMKDVGCGDLFGMSLKACFLKVDAEH